MKQEWKRMEFMYVCYTYEDWKDGPKKLRSYLFGVHTIQCRSVG